MRVLVVDDEPVARRRLGRMLAAMPGVDVAGEAENGHEALAQIERLAPDAVLLDIRMPGLDGLSLAASAESLPPIVFTTAYDEYAVDAFEVAAVDYLLKPVNRERLAAALDRVRERRAPVDRASLERVLAHVVREGAASDPAPVTARFGNTVRVFDPREISRFHASQKYTLFRQDGREYVLDESLNALEARLSCVGFLRIHRGELVNLKRVKAVRNEDGSTVVELSDGQAATASRRLASVLKERLGVR